MSVLILRPNSDNSVAQARSAGSYNYACIDEETKSRTDYTLSDSATPKLDIYGFPDHSSESGTINSVTIKAYADNGSGFTGSINFAIKISSTVYAAGAQNTSDTETLYSSSWATNPATSSAWSWTEIDDLLAGDYLKGNDSKQVSWCYQLWVEVDYTEGAGGVTIPVFMYHYTHH